MEKRARARARIAWTEPRRRMDGVSSTHGRSLVDAWTEPRRRMDEFGPSGGVTFVAEPSAFSERGKTIKVC